MATVRDIEKQFMKASDMASEFVETEARRILREHPALHEFVMAMGIWSFTTREGESYMPGFYTTPKYIKNSRLAKFIFQWDEYLKITGEPMRFTADGPTIRNW